MDDPLDLQAIGVEKDFQAAYKKVLTLLQKGDSGSVTIKVGIKRPEEMDTMVELTTAVSMSAPPPKKKKLLGRIDGEGAIKVEAIQEENNVIALFSETKGKEG